MSTIPRVISHLTNKQVIAYMKTRYPGAKFIKAADSWYLGQGNAMSAADARLAAESEVDLWQKGISIRPIWFYERTSDYQFRVRAAAAIGEDVDWPDEDEDEWQPDPSYSAGYAYAAGYHD